MPVPPSFFPVIVARTLAIAVVLAVLPTVAGARPRVAALKLSAIGVQDTLVQSLDEQFPREFAVNGCCQVISSSEIMALFRLEATKQKLGCDDDSEACLTEVAGALGVAYVATGSVGRVGESWTLSLTLVSVRDAHVLARATRTVKGTPDALIEALASAAHELSAPLAPSKPLAAKVLLGVGAAALAGALGTGLAWRSMTGAADFRQAQLASANRLAFVTNVLLGAGLAAGVAGGVVLFVAGGDGSGGELGVGGNVLMRGLALATLSLVVLAGCPQLAPDFHPFPCRDDADCVAGWTCGAGDGARFCLKSGEITDAGSPPDGGHPADECGLTDLGVSAPRVDGETWTVQYSGAASELPNAMVRGTDGSLYIVGTVGDADGVKFDAMLVKLQPDGAFRWCRRLSGVGSHDRHEWNAIALDPGGSIFVSGITNSPVVEGIAERGSDVIVARYEPDGSRTWLVEEDFSLSADTPADDHSVSLALDDDGHVRVVGETNGAPAGESVSPTGSSAALFLAYDASGHRIAARTHADPFTWSSARAVTSGGGSTVAITLSDSSLLGTPLDTRSFGWMTLFDLGTPTAPVATRELEIIDQPDMAGGTGGPGALMILDGQVVAIGQVDEQIAGTSPLGRSDAFAIRFGGSAVRWATRFGSVDDDDPRAFVSCGDSLCVAGNTLKPETPGGPGIQWDAFLATLNPGDGTAETITSFGTNLDERLAGIVNDGNGGVIVVGSTQGDLGRHNGGTNDLFVRRMKP